MSTPRRSRRLVAAILTAATAFAIPTATVITGTGVATAIPAGLDELGRPTPEILTQVEKFAHQPGIPEDVRSTLLRLVGFFRGDGESEIEIPENGPAFTQFGWPTVASSCIGGSAQSMGTAIAVPGPALLPLPGVPIGHTSFIFTALGTGPASTEQSTSMRVNWMNISTGAMGQTPMTRGLVNPYGPGTLTGLAETGAGTVIAVLSGGVTTDEDTGPVNCEFAPTIGLTNVN